MEPCSLYAVRVWAEPNCKVQLCKHSESVPSSVLFPEHGKMHGVVMDDWIMLQLPKGNYEAGVYGLPLTGGQHSWESRWENNYAGLEVKIDGHWQEVDDWSQVQKVCASA